MVTKLVVGLTNVLHEEFVPMPQIPELYNNETVSVDTYAISASCNVAATETLTWTLNTELPAVTGLITTIEQMKTRLTLKEVTLIKQAPIDGYNSFSLLFGILNYVPNMAVTYTEFTDDDYNSSVPYPKFGDIILEEVHGYEINGFDHTRLLSYAVSNERTDYLMNAYPARSAVPMFNVRFKIGERNNMPQRTISTSLEDWFNANVDVLTAKGWDLNNPKSRLGFYVAGSLIGDPWEQYLKLSTNPYICSIDIVEE